MSNPYNQPPSNNPYDSYSGNPYNSSPNDPYSPSENSTVMPIDKTVRAADGYEGYPPPVSGDPYSVPPYSAANQPNSYNPNPMPNTNYGNSGPNAYPPYFSPPPPRKKNTGLWIALGIIGGLIVLAIIGCAVLGSLAVHDVNQSDTSNNSTASSTPSTSSTDTSSTDTGNNSGSSVVNIGQTQTSSGVDCTITSAKQIPGDDYAQPDAGKQFIVVHVKIVNHSSGKKHYNPYDFHVISQGKVGDQALLSPSSVPDTSQLDYGDLLPGASVKGDIVFEIYSGDHNAMVSWEPTWIFSNTQYEWKLGL